ncbi:MAG: ABC transporter ATP-binding protein [Eubacteriaceae bacterium]|jgi:iron complex transport system ATP-binding protein|nr:ABC transporter ATP-binding protein [Eubacteriaceae bacterium]
MLKTKNLTFSYRSKIKELAVFKDLNVSCKKGFNVILGPNGAGKSTLLKSIFGLLNYDGTIWCGEGCVTEMSMDDKTKFMSYLPQIDISTSSLSVFEMVLLGLLPGLRQRVKKEDVRQVVNMLEALNIAHLTERNFSELSGGQKKMVFIAQTLVRDPKIILLDEPVNSLDLQRQLELCFFLKKIIEDKEISVIVVLHDINLAARFADHLIVLNDRGELYSTGSPEEVVTETMLKEVYGVVASIHHDAEGTPTVSALKSVNN